MAVWSSAHTECLALIQGIQFPALLYAATSSQTPCLHNSLAEVNGKVCNLLPHGIALKTGISTWFNRPRFILLFQQRQQ